MLKNISSFALRATCNAALAALALAGGGVVAQTPTAPTEPSYADLADLADEAGIVLRAEIRKQAELEPERARGVAPGHVRLYIEARTQALVSGRSAVGESLRYLVDVPRDARGKAPKLRTQIVLLFARPATGRPGEIQLVTPTAQISWTPEREARLRPILTELAAPDAPPPITGIRDVLSIAGNLVGESETQLFVSTERDGPVSISVVRRPGQSPVWGVSWSDIVDQAAAPPRPDTLAWYRLACFLPPSLPSDAQLSAGPADRQRAASDYRFVLERLGPCPRTRV